MSRPLVSRFMGASPWEEVYGNTYIPGRIERRCECTWRGSTNETRTPAGNFHFYTEPPLYDLPRGCERANRVRALTGVSAFSFYSLLFEREGEREREVCVFCWRKDDSRNRSIKRVQPKFIHREGMNRPFLFFSVRRRRTTTGSKRFDKKNLKSRGLEASLFTAREAMAEATESVNTGC